MPSELPVLDDFDPGLPEQTPEEEVEAALSNIKKLPIDAITEAIIIAPEARTVFDQVKTILNGTSDDKAAEITAVQATTQDSFLNLHANIATRILDETVETIPEEEKEKAFVILQQGFSFLEKDGTERSKDGDMRRSIETMIELGKSSANPAIHRILKDSLEETFPDVLELIAEAQKEEEREKNEEKSKNDEDDNKELKDKIVGGGLAGTMLALTLAIPPQPIAGGALAFVLWFAHKKFYAKDKGDKSKENESEEDKIFLEAKKYENAFKQFLPPVLTEEEENEQQGGKTNFEEASDNIAEQAQNELDDVKQSLKNVGKELQNKNKEVHEKLLSETKESSESSKIAPEENTKQESDFFSKVSEIASKIGKQGFFGAFDDTNNYEHPDQNLPLHENTNKTPPQIPAH